MLIGISNIPIGAIVLVLIFFLFHVPKVSQDKTFDSMTPVQKFIKLDPLGSLLIIAAVISILLALQWGGQSVAWDLATIIGLLVAFPLFVFLFAVVQ
jgi:MFS transporter, DHA2 family, glioxin efflux transporter